PPRHALVRGVWRGLCLHPRQDCRPPAAPARAAAGTLVVDPLTAKRLRLSAGASVRAVPLSAQKRA
ncbi:hypothetical protein I4939_04455, partial [Pseudomonas aeruginosa]|nr:hypothetical protein [Pseudomonas aeruginosa]